MRETIQRIKKKRNDGLTNAGSTAFVRSWRHIGATPQCAGRRRDLEERMGIMSQSARKHSRSGMIQDERGRLFIRIRQRCDVCAFEGKGESDEAL